jgi:serine/threonine protein kinase
MELTVQNVYGLLLRSKLMSIDEAKAMYVRWQQEAKDAANNLARFAAWMVANRYVTEYQASLLARGHAEGFFLNEYKILDRLGKGRMAGVYKAQHQLGQIVAIKVLPPSKAKEGNLLARFHREARLALRLKHPNVVRAFQTGVADGLNYLVMEYLEGETLDDVLSRRGKMAPGEAARLVYQALQGLQHVHAQGLVHRDLKPSNLMLVGSTPETTLHATVKILDMGLGRTLFEDGSEEGDGGLTGEGVLLGTPDYMAPEQARDARVADIRADIYSLGCVLYHLLAGQPPFPDTNIISQMIRHATETPRPLKELNSAVPEGLQQILNWMLAKEPAQRYPTPERAAQALQMFLAAGTDTLSAPESDPRMRPYLSWLEVETGKAALAKMATIPAVPIAKQPSGLHPTAPRTPADQPTRAGEKARAPGATSRPVPEQQQGKRLKKKRHPPATHAAAPQAAAPVAQTSEPDETVPVTIDVELVPAETVVAEQPAGGFRLTRRDVIVFGIGAGAGGMVTFMGYLIARLVH